MFIEEWVYQKLLREEQEFRLLFKRYEIPFYRIESEAFEKTEQELLVYDLPITKILEENSVKDIADLIDEQLLGSTRCRIGR